MGIPDGRRHEIRRFVAGVAKHQALVALPLIRISSGNGRRPGQYPAIVCRTPPAPSSRCSRCRIGVVVSNAPDRIPRNLNIIDVCRGGDFASKQHQPGIAQGFGGNPRLGSCEDGVEDGIRNLVGNLVRVPFRDRFGCKQKVVFCHSNSSWFKADRPAVRVSELRCTWRPETLKPGATL